ncbi:MAG: hypothetical protein NC117_02875 [Pseudoflavonifractor sp.]|nr:hypothetical protein [Pseudoflavonifractor sp.]
MRQPSTRALLTAGGITAAATLRAVLSMDSTAMLILVLCGVAVMTAIAATIDRRARHPRHSPRGKHGLRENHYKASKMRLTASCTETPRASA